MNIKKISGSLAVALAMLGFAGIAQADCSVESEKIKMHTSWLKCIRDGGQWSHDAIWQSGKASKKKDAVGDNCDVQFNLAKQLFVLHDEPPKGRGNGNGNNTAKGAAGALDDHKYEDALLHLQNFIDTSSKAKLNPEFTPVPVKDPTTGDIIGYRDAVWYANAFRDFAANIKLSIFDPADGTGCSVGAP